MQDPKQTEVPQPRQENHLFWDHKQTPGNQSWQQQKQSPNPEPLQGNEPMRVLTSIPLKHMLLLVPKQSQDEPPSLEVQPSAVPKQSQDDPPSLEVQPSAVPKQSQDDLPSLEVQPSAVPKQSQDDLPSLEVQPSAVPKQSQDDPPSLEVEPLADQKQLPDRKPLLAHQMSPVLSETTDIQPLPDSKQTPQHQPLQDKPSPDISPCSSSEKPHQPSVVVKAVADSACDSSVQQVTPRHQEPAENEPTSTVSEDPEPSETPSTPEVLDSDTEEPSSSNCQDFKLSLWQPRVSLDRLPLALPKPGGPLPSFLLVPGDAEDEFYLEELSEDSESHDDDITDDDSKPLSHDDDIKDDDSKPQSHNDDITDDESKPLSHDDDVTDDDVTDDDVTDDDSKPQSHDDDFTVCYTEPLSSPDSPPTLQTVSCSACGSANGSIICSACGRGYHRDCHVPTVGCDIWMEWTCSLCQDLSDPSDPHSWDRPQRAENLSLQDQKRCESLLLYLKVEGCSLLSKMDWVWSRLKTMSERLTRRRHPEYEASAELIYDVWRLLQDAARDDDSVNTLMENFKNKVTEAFSSDLNSPRRRAHTQHAVMSQTEQVSEGSEVIEVVDDECELKNARKRLGDFSDLNEVKKRKTDNMTLPPSRSKQTPPSGFIS
nr:uncharacterized protein LOC110003739 isoform X2 [Labrus bergylta]